MLRVAFPALIFLAVACTADAGSIRIDALAAVDPLPWVHAEHSPSNGGENTFDGLLFSRHIYLMPASREKTGEDSAALPSTSTVGGVGGSGNPDESSAVFRASSIWAGALSGISGDSYATLDARNGLHNEPAWAGTAWDSEINRGVGNRGAYLTEQQTEIAPVAHNIPMFLDGTKVEKTDYGANQNLQPDADDSTVTARSIPDSSGIHVPEPVSLVLVLFGLGACPCMRGFKSRDLIR